MIHALLGFAIALAVGMTGIGGGSFTVPALLLIAGLPAGEAVGTAFVFAGALRLLAAPFYLLRRQIHSRYFWLLLQGAVPGLLLGICALRFLADQQKTPVIAIILGLLLASSSLVTFVPRAQNRAFAVNNSRWLPWLALPIGVESGFSSAGAGALGTVLLLNYSEMSPAQVVGTDLLFGLVLAAIGSALHWTFGTVSLAALSQLLLGGVPGVVLGCLFGRILPAHKLRSLVAAVAICAGLQLVWSGAKDLEARHAKRIAPTMVAPAKSTDPQRTILPAPAGRLAGLHSLLSELSPKQMSRSASSLTACDSLVRCRSTALPCPFFATNF